MSTTTALLGISKWTNSDGGIARTEKDITYVAGTSAAAQPLVPDADGDLTMGGNLTLNGATNALNFTGTTPGTDTDGSLIKAGTNGSKIPFSTAGQKGIAIFMDNLATSGTLTGMRLRSAVNPASAANSVDNFLGQVSIESGKDATTVNVGFLEVIPKGTNTITTSRVLLLNADSAASQTVTDHIILHARVHTRGDETHTNDEMIRLENEAVGGNGRQLDSFIRITETNMSGGIKAAAYLIDAGTSTSLLATAVARIPDDGTVANDTDTGSATDLQFSDFTGYLTVVVGSATRYIPLLTSKPSDLT
jgi:hypothetical protein